jgi:hypothetical protein
MGFLHKEKMDILEHVFSKLMVDIEEAVDRVRGSSGRNDHVEGLSQCFSSPEFLRETIKKMFAVEKVFQGEFDALGEARAGRFVFEVEVAVVLERMVFAVVSFFIG